MFFLWPGQKNMFCSFWGPKKILNFVKFLISFFRLLFEVKGTTSQIFEKKMLFFKASGIFSKYKLCRAHAPPVFVHSTLLTTSCHLIPEVCNILAFYCSQLNEHVKMFYTVQYDQDNAYLNTKSNTKKYQNMYDFLPQYVRTLLCVLSDKK